MMFNRILVALDGSTTAEAILTPLRRIARPDESEIILFQAQPMDAVELGPEPEKYLRGVAFQLASMGYASRPLLRPGMAADAILDAARSEQASMIALSTHGRSGVARWILGSVAEKVLQASALPVFVARSFDSPVSRGPPGSKPVRNILLPLDGSRLSMGVLEPVLRLAGPVDAHVTLLHVDEPSPFEGRWPPPDETLQGAEQTLRSACIPAAVTRRTGDPGVEILKAAAELAIDLIAMTTHGRSGPSRWVFGSVTAKVLRSAVVPMIVVRHLSPSPASPLRR